MGIYRRFIGGVQSPEQSRATDHSTDKPVTPADALTVARPILAAVGVHRLFFTERPEPVGIKERVKTLSEQVSPWVAVAGASDMEGALFARPIDRLAKVFPFLEGYGSTKHGESNDKFADVAAILELAPALLISPRVSLLGKIATGIVLGQEGYKTVWALRKNSQYMNYVKQLETVRAVREQVHGEIDFSPTPTLPTKLELPPNESGKEAMAEKLTAIGLVAATADTKPGPLRTAFGATAVGFAVVGSLRGEGARRSYENEVATMIRDMSDQVTFEQQALTVMSN